MMKTRYFVIRDRDGTLGALFKSEWEDGRVISEAYWDYPKGTWEPSKVINKWNHFGDTDIDEIQDADFKAIFETITQTAPDQ